MVGDQILYCLEPETLLLVGLGVDNWVEYHAVTGGYDVTVERDPIYVLNPSGRRTLYRFQIEGPNATALLEAVTGGPLPEIKFFNFVELKIANCPVWRSEEHTSELQSRENLVCRLLLEKKKKDS